MKFMLFLSGVCLLFNMTTLAGVMLVLAALL